MTSRINLWFTLPIATNAAQRGTMDKQHNEVMTYVLDYPEQAARELQRLRNIETAARDLIEKFDVLVGALTVTE